jgi:hypothetical protein
MSEVSNLILASALELVVLTDCPPGPEDLMKLVYKSDLLIFTSLKDSYLDVAK